MKNTARILALMLCLTALCLGAGAQENSYILTMEGEALLVNGQGQALTPRGAYTRLERAGGWYLAAAAEGGVQVLDNEGNPAMDMAFEDAYPDEEVIYVQEGGLMGALDMQLNWLAPCAYSQLAYNGEGGFLALSSDPYDERPDGVYYLNGQGEEKATGVRIKYGLSRFDEGLMPVMDGVSGRMGYLNPLGEWAITAQYQYAGEFKNGAAEAALAAGAGFIDTQGNWLLTPKYMSVGRSSGPRGMILAQEDSSQVLLMQPEDFSILARFEGADVYFSAGYDQDIAILYLDDSTRLIDGQGNTLVECGVEDIFDAWPAAWGQVLVSQGEWGGENVWLYSLDGEKVAGPWQEAWLLGQTQGKGLYAVSSFQVYETVEADISWHAYEQAQEGYTLSVFDDQGSEIIPPRSWTYLYLEGDLLAYEDEKGAGLLSLDGKEICRFERLEG